MSSASIGIEDIVSKRVRMFIDSYMEWQKWIKPRQMLRKAVEMGKRTLES